MDNTYESRDLLDQYLLFHYGSAEEILPYAFGPRAALDFPARCVTELFASPPPREHASALDIGCAVGRSSFELARFCRRVVAVDASQSFITAARTLAQKGFLEYQRAEEGIVRSRMVAAVPVDIDRSRVDFRVADALDLPTDFAGFDIVLACNLLCRLAEPGRLLKRLPDLVAPNGQLLITTPCSWLPEYTGQEHWLGGTQDNPSTFNTLKNLMSPDFELLNVRDMPFLIREHPRKYQWSVAQATHWQRR